MSSPRIVRVPPNWRHPLSPETGGYISMAPAADYAVDLAEWQQSHEDPDDDLPPDRADYMPDWPEEVATHFMLYENVSEGSPISPAFATADELWAWVGGRTFTALVAEMYHARCVFCDARVSRPVEFAIHGDNNMDGPEFNLCRACGEHEDPDCDTIWARVNERRVDGSLRSVYFSKPHRR